MPPSFDSHNVNDFSVHNAFVSNFRLILWICWMSSCLIFWSISVCVAQPPTVVSAATYMINTTWPNADTRHTLRYYLQTAPQTPTAADSAALVKIVLRLAHQYTLNEQPDKTQALYQVAGPHLYLLGDSLAADYRERFAGVVASAGLYHDAYQFYRLRIQEAIARGDSVTARIMLECQQELILDALLRGIDVTAPPPSVNLFQWFMGFMLSGLLLLYIWLNRPLRPHTIEQLPGGQFRIHQR